MMCLWFDRFLFIPLVMGPMVEICGVCQVLFSESRGCSLIFLQHFPCHLWSSSVLRSISIVVSVSSGAQ